MNVSISRNGAELGEWTEDEVRTLYKNGKLLPTDHYWKEGMTEWQELSRMIKPAPPAGKTQPIDVAPTNPTPPASPLVAPKQPASSSNAPQIKRQLNPHAKSPLQSIIEGEFDLLTAREMKVEDEFIAGYQAIANMGKTAIIVFLSSFVCLGIGFLGALEDNSISKIAWLGLLLYIAGLVYYTRFRRIIRGLHGAVIGAIALIVAPFLIFAFIRMDYRDFKGELDRLMLKMNWKGRVEPRF